MHENSLPPPPPTRHWVDVHGAAQRLGLSDRSVRDYITRGTLRGYRIGGSRIRLDLAEVDALIQPIPPKATK